MLAAESTSRKSFPVRGLQELEHRSPLSRTVLGRDRGVPQCQVSAGVAAPIGRGAREGQPPAAGAAGAKGHSPGGERGDVGVHAHPVRNHLYLQVMLLNELIDGTEIDQVLLVREAERRQRRDGGEYLRLQLGDRTGAVACMVWEDLVEVGELARAGVPVRVRGRYTVHPRFGPQINLRSIEVAEPGAFDPKDLLDGPARDVGQMEREIRELLGTIQEPHLRVLLEHVFGEGSELWAGYRVAPAAKYYHQAYRHGLLEHSLGVAQAVSAISATFAGIDRDVAVTGALLHDVGKLEAYTADPQNIDLTDAGRLQGEIALGYYRIRRLIEDIEGFPAELAQAVAHIILSHHGTLEHGSPVVPCTREATLVHMIDNLGGRLGSFDRLEKELAPGRRWSGFDRAIGGGAFFAERGGEQAQIGEPPVPVREAA
jgi:3'-5' exoribonuclease